MEKMKTYTLDEITDEVIGKIGTPNRDKFESDLKNEIQAYHLGEAIKQARIAKNMTQEQLGEKAGILKSNISKIEKGKGITITTMIRLFKAMDVQATLDMGCLGRVSLC